MSALTALLDLRPQGFGDLSPNKVSNPIVEPLWEGVRVLAAVEGLETAIADEAGAPVSDHPPIEVGLTRVLEADGVVVDGFLTKQVAHDGVGAYFGTEPIPPTGKLIAQSMVGTRRSRTAEAAERLERDHAARTFAPDDVVTLMVIDLLWVDGVSLIDVPLLERRRQLEAVLGESDLIRRGVYVRPPIDTWIGSWRALGFDGITFKSANGHYRPGAKAKDDWATAPMPRR